MLLSDKILLLSLIPAVFIGVIWLADILDATSDYKARGIIYYIQAIGDRIQPLIGIIFFVMVILSAVLKTIDLVFK